MKDPLSALFPQFRFLPLFSRKDGILFDKAAILEYIIAKKNEFSRKLKEYEKQKKSEEDELLELASAEDRKKLENFIKSENSVSSSKTGAIPKVQPTASGSSGISNMSADKKEQLPSFWAPSQTPSAKQSKVEKPSNTIYCPITNKPLKAKDLITVKFTEAPSDDKKSLIAKEVRYMCPITRDALSNSVPCAIIKTTLV